MLKDLINIERIELSAERFKIYFIKKYVEKTAIAETFLIQNPAVLLMKSGTFQIKLKEIERELKPHDLVLLPKNTSVAQLAAPVRLQFFLITFSVGKNGHYLNYGHNDLLSCNSGGEAAIIGLEENEYRVLSLICRLLYAEINNQLLNEFEMKLRQISLNLLLFELNLLCAKYLSAANMACSQSEKLASQFLAVLSIHCRKHHSVKFYAGALYVSAQYLGEVMKKITGKSAKMIINEAVLSEALDLLENPIYSMAEIADELEFGSVASFSSFFKKAMSCTPSQYRKNAIERFKSR